MRWPVKVKSRIALVSDYDAADRVPEGSEVFLVEADSVSVRDLVDEEIMLALPNVPRHEEGSECAGRKMQLSGQGRRAGRTGRHAGSETACTVGRTVETQVVVARRGLVPCLFRKVVKRRRKRGMHRSHDGLSEARVVRSIRSPAKPTCVTASPRRLLSRQARH